MIRGWKLVQGYQFLRMRDFHALQNRVEAVKDNCNRTHTANLYTKTTFEVFCQSFYTCLWNNYTRRAYNALRVRHNNVFSALMGLGRRSGTLRHRWNSPIQEHWLTYTNIKLKILLTLDARITRMIIF